LVSQPSESQVERAFARIRAGQGITPREELGLVECCRM
jgi:hypothetical protein